jgi:predicted methyltransferase
MTLRTLLLLLLSLCTPAIAAEEAAPPGADRLVAALEHASRSATDRERDARDHPHAVLGLAGFGAGQTIADVFGGGGYYSEIIARVVGPDGKVLLVNNAPYDDYAKADHTVRLAADRLPNVAYRVTPENALGLGTEALDGALIVNSYHDLFVHDGQHGWPVIDPAQFIDQIVTALKPGGVLLIVDHAATAGSGVAAAPTLHRIDEAFARKDLAERGLVFERAIDALRNPDDARTLNVFDAAIKGRTDRFVHLYRKPR